MTFQDAIVLLYEGISDNIGILLFFLGACLVTWLVGIFSKPSCRHHDIDSAGLVWAIKKSKKQEKENLHRKGQLK
jgi:hypothetical protein